MSSNREALLAAGKAKLEAFRKSKKASPGLIDDGHASSTAASAPDQSVVNQAKILLTSCLGDERDKLTFGQTHGPMHGQTQDTPDEPPQSTVIREPSGPIPFSDPPSPPKYLEELDRPPLSPLAHGITMATKSLADAFGSPTSPDRPSVKDDTLPTPSHSFQPLEGKGSSTPSPQRPEEGVSDSPIFFSKPLTPSLEPEDQQLHTSNLDLFMGLKASAESTESIRPTWLFGEISADPTVETSTLETLSEAFSPQIQPSLEPLEASSTSAPSPTPPLPSLPVPPLPPLPPSLLAPPLTPSPLPLPTPSPPAPSPPLPPPALATPHPPLPTPPLLPRPPPPVSFLDAYLDNLLSTDVIKPQPPKQPPHDDPTGSNRQSQDGTLFHPEESSLKPSTDERHVKNETASTLQDDISPSIHLGLPPRHPTKKSSEPQQQLDGMINRRDSIESYASSGHDRLNQVSMVNGMGVGVGVGGGGGGGEVSSLPRVSSSLTESGQHFTALQEHIDELTEDKMALQRGLARQQKVAEELSRENQTLAEQYNAQARLVDSLQKKIQRYEDELEAQVLSLEGLSSERDAARTLAHEASSRATTIAAEAVELEQKLLAEKSLRLRAESSAANAVASSSRLEKQVLSLKHELQEAREEAERSALERRALAVRAKQLESRLEKAMDEGYKVKPIEGPSPPPTSLAPDLMVPPQGEAAAAAAGGRASDHVSRPETCEAEVQCSMDDTTERGQGPAAAKIELEPSPSFAFKLDESNQQVPETSEVGETREEETAIHSGARKGDATSQVLADRALSLLAGRGKKLPSATQPSSSSSSLPSSTKDAMSLIACWLPMGPIGGNDPVAAVAEEEVRAVHSIHDLLADYEAAVDELLVGLAGCRERELQARAESQGLRSQLEKLKGIVVELPLGGESPTRSLASPLPSFISTRGTPTYTPLTPEAATRDSSLLATSDSSSYVMHTPDQRKSFIPPADQQSITPAAQQRTDLPGLPSSWTPSQDDDEPSVTPKRGWLGFILGSSPNPQAKKRMRG